MERKGMKSWAVWAGDVTYTSYDAYRDWPGLRADIVYPADGSGYIAIYYKLALMVLIYPPFRVWEKEDRITEAIRGTFRDHEEP